MVRMPVPHGLGLLVQPFGDIRSLGPGLVVLKGVVGLGAIGGGDKMDDHVVPVIPDAALVPACGVVDSLLDLLGAVSCVVHDSSVREDDDVLLLDGGNGGEVVLEVHLHLHDSFLRKKMRKMKKVVEWEKTIKKYRIGSFLR